jgi:hypothetical protein
VDVGSANRRGGDPDDRFAGSRHGPGNFFDCNSIFTFEDDRFHRFHDDLGR